MNKVIVIGCPGAGKSTFSKKLSLILKLPLFHLDFIWHKPDRTNIAREEFDLRLADILGKSQWIIDGNYNRTLERRLAECDTVFLFDIPVEDCIIGATERVGKQREDIPWVETELDSEFKSFIEAFPKESLPHIYELLEKYGEGRQIIIFKSRKEADLFLNNI